jgi:non-ribosomal peptide synthetase component F
MTDPLNTAGIRGLDTWNATGCYNPCARVDELFELRAEERPADIAVTLLDRSMSYGTLSAATRLQSLGILPGTLVGICMDRCMEMVPAL